MLTLKTLAKKHQSFHRSETSMIESYVGAIFNTNFTNIKEIVKVVMGIHNLFRAAIFIVI